jgi:hypothetical protein
MVGMTGPPGREDRGSWSGGRVLQAERARGRGQDDRWSRPRGPMVPVGMAARPDREDRCSWSGWSLVQTETTDGPGGHLRSCWSGRPLVVVSTSGGAGREDRTGIVCKIGRHRTATFGEKPVAWHARGSRRSSAHADVALDACGTLRESDLRLGRRRGVARTILRQAWTMIVQQSRSVPAQGPITPRAARNPTKPSPIVTPRRRWHSRCFGTATPQI